MSTTVHQHYACERDGCSNQYTPPEAVVGSYCSAYCYYSVKGANALAKILADRRFCGTCFRPIKEVAPPPDEWTERATSKLDLALGHGASFEGGSGNQLVLDVTDCPDTVQPVAADAIVGHQHRTPHTAWATDKDADGPGAPIYRERWGCQCGTVDPATRDEVIERVERETVVLGLLRMLSQLAAEGNVARRPSKDELFDALREHGRDWEYAIGRCLYADPR